MVGRTLSEQYPHVPHDVGEPVLEVTGPGAARSCRAASSLTLRRGEILGIAGIVGAGRTELLRARLRPRPGARRRGDGALGRAVAAAAHAARRASRQGVGLLSEDRKGEGLALIQSIADNLTYSRLSPVLLLRLAEPAARGAGRRATGWRGCGVRCAGPEQPVGELSGGNQQKVALGRLLHQEADVLLLDEPTRGVDVGSKAEIYRLIGELAAQGKAVLFV